MGLDALSALLEHMLPSILSRSCIVLGVISIGMLWSKIRLGMSPWFWTDAMSKLSCPSNRSGMGRSFSAMIGPEHHLAILVKSLWAKYPADALPLVPEHSHGSANPSNTKASQRPEEEA